MRKSDYCQQMVESGLLQKGHLGGVFAFFFGLAIFFISGVLALGGEVKEVERRDTLQNKGVRSVFTSLHVDRLDFAKCFLNILFAGLTCFSEVRIFDQVGFGGQKKAWGCRAEVVLKMAFFTFFLGEDQFVILGARGCVTFWVRVGLVALRLRCGGFCDFFGVFVLTPF